jgi:hypothetical protein
MDVPRILRSPERRVKLKVWHDEDDGWARGARLFMQASVHLLGGWAANYCWRLHLLLFI